MAPTLSLVAKWLRKEKHIDITIVVDSHGFKYERYYALSIINRNILVGPNRQRLLLHHLLMIMQRKLDVKIGILQTTIKIQRKEKENLTSQSTEPNTSAKTQPKKRKKTNRKEYYRKYNQEHPKILNRGFTKGYINGNINDGPIYPNTDFLGRRILGYDEFGMPVTNDQFGDMMKNYEMIWHDDDWCEEPD